MSQSIDERIVEMRFDNKQFESGAKETLNTLEKLEKALDLEGAAKGFDKIEEAAKNVSLEGIAKGIEQLQDRFSTLGIVGMRVIQNITDSIMNTLSSAVSYVTDAIISGGLKRAQNIENAHFQLQALLKDEEQVQAVMDNAMASVDGTAYAYDEAAKAASQFAASGMRAGEEMVSALRAITGVAAMTNSEYEGISRIFTTVAGNGRLMGDQLLQLSSRGLNAAATLADYFQQVKGLTDITESDIRKMVSDSKISFEDFASAMDWAFGESAFRANETFTGALSNMRSALARIGAGFFSPLIEQNSDLILMINTVRERINDVKKALVFDEQTSAISGLAKATSMTTSELQDMFSEIDKNGSLTIEQLKSLSKNGVSVTKSLTDYINGVVDGSIRSTYSTKTALDELTGGLKVSQNDVLKYVTDGKINLATFTSAMETAYGDQLNLSKQFTDSVLNMTQKISAFLKSVDLSTGLSVFYYGVESIKNAFKGLYSVLEPVGKAFSNVFLSFSGEDVLNVAEKIEKFTSKLKLSETASNNLRIAFEGVFNVIKLLLDGFIGLIGIVSPVTKPIGSLSERFTGLAASIGSGLTKLTEWIRESPTVEKVYGIISSAVQKASNSVLNFITHIGEYLKKIYELPITRTIIDSLVESFRKLHDNGSKFLGFLITKLGEFRDSVSKMIPDSIKDVFNNFIDKLKEIKESFATMDSTKAGEAFQNFTNKVKGLGDVLKSNEGLNTFITNMKQFFNNLTDAFTLDTLFDNIDKFKARIGSFANWIKDTLAPLFGDLTLGGVISSASSFGSIFAIIKMAKSLGKFADVINAIPNMFGSIKNTLVAYQTELKADAIKKIATAILLLSAALTILSFADTERVYKAAVALGLVGAALIAALGLFQTGLAKMKGYVATIYTVANTVAKSLNNLAKAVKWKAIGSAVKDMATALGVIIAAVLVLAYAYYKDGDDIEKALITIGIIAAAMVGLIAIVSVLGNKLKDGMKAFTNASTGILELSASLLIIVTAMKKLFKLEIPGDYESRLEIMKKVFIGLGALTLVVVASGKIAGKDSGSVTGPILGLVAALYLCIVAIQKLFKTNIPDDYKEKFAILTAVFTELIAVVLIMAVASRISENGLKSASTILAMCAAIATIVAALVILQFFSEDKLRSAAINLGITLIALGLSIAASAKAAGKDSWKTVLAMVMDVAVITTALGTLSMISEDKLMTAAKSLGIVLLALATDLYAASKITAKNSFESIVAMAATVGIIAFSLHALSDQPWDGMISGAASLSLVLLSISQSFKTISKAKPDTNAITAFLIGTIGTIMLAMAISVLSNQPWDGMLSAAASLSLVLLAMAEAFKIMSSANPDLGTLIGFVGGLLGVGVIALILSELSSKPWESMLAAATSIALVMDSMAIALALCTVAGKAAPSAAEGILLLDAFILNLWALLETLGLLSGVAGDFLDKGAELLIKLGTYLGEFIGGILGGIVSQTLLTIADALPQIGDDLSEFADNAKPFFDTMENLSSNVLTGTKALAEAILILTAAELLNGIGSFISFIFGGSTSFADFGNQLKDLGEGIKAFAESIDGVDTSDVETAANCARILAGIYDNLPKEDGWWQKIFGQTKSLSDFADELIPFGVALVAYSNVVKGNIDNESIKASISAAKVLAAFADTLPEMGGLLQKIFGQKKTLSEFGAELVPFGSSLVDYSSIVNGKVNQNAVEASIRAAEVLKAFADGLPDIGGLASVIFGKQKTLSEFGEELKPFGTSMALYSKTVSGRIDEGAVNSSARAAQILLDLSNGLPDKTSLVKKIFGSSQKTLSEFGEEIVPFAIAMVKYCKELEKGKINEEAIATSVKAAEILVGLQNNLPEMDGFIKKAFGTDKQTLSDFATGIVKFGKAMADFSDRVSGNIDYLGVSTTVTAAGRLAELQSSLTGESGLLSLFSRTTNLEDFGKELGKFGSGMVDYSDKVKSIDTSSFASVNEEVAHLIEIAIGTDSINMFSMNSFVDNLKKMADKGIDGFINAFEGSTESVQAVINQMFVTANGQVLISGEETTENARLIASGIVNAFTNEINSSKAAINEAMSVFSSEVVGTTEESLPKSTFSSIGQNLITWQKEGMTSKQSNLMAEAKNIGEALIAKFKSTLPTKTFTSLGETLMDALSTGISNKKEKVKSSAVDLCNAAIKAFKDNFTSAQMKSIGEAAAEGLAIGITNKIESIKNAAVNAANKAISSAKYTLGVASPSKKFKEIGEYVSIGLANGIMSKLDVVAKASDDLGDESLDVMSQVIESITKLIDDESDFNPVITPIIDLSYAEESINQMDEMLNRFNRFASYTSATDMSYSVDRRLGKVSSDSDLSKDGDSTKATYIMNQYNNSPKALSRSDIYRQTKNLFSRMKEATS